MLQFLKVAAPGISCMFALASCFCWMRSATVKVRYSPEYYADRLDTQTKVDNTGKYRVDLRRTAEVRGKWNSVAAAAASLAAFFQAITLSVGV